MDETKNEEAVVEESLDLPEIAEDQEDTTDWKAEAKKLQDKAIAQRERTKALKAKAKDAEAKLAELAKNFVKPSELPKTGELDETQLDYLDLKGITEDEDISVIRKVMKNTGDTLRQVLKDEYVVTALKANKEARENKAATPSATKRAGAQQDSLEAATAKYERDGTLPADFDLRKKVVNAMYLKKKGNAPAWHQ